MSCVSEIAASIGINCSSPIVAGYTGREILIPYSISPIIVKDADNPRIVRSLTLPTGAKVAKVENLFTTPFEGSSQASNGDNGRMMATKTTVLRVPLRGAEASAEIVEPILNSAEGYLLVQEMQDKSGVGSYRLLGLQQPLRATADGASQSEFENGGDTVLTLSCNESWWDCELCVDGSAETPATTNYLATKAMFNTLWAAAL